MSVVRASLAAAIVVLSSVACSSPARPTRAGDAASSRAADAENPFREPGEPRSREEIVARYLGSRGVTLHAAPEVEWSSLASELAVVLTVRNAGAAEVVLLGERSTGFWPFRTFERAKATHHVAGTLASTRTRVRTVNDALPVDAAETIVVPPGAERSLRMVVPLPLAADVECAELLVRPILHPLAILVGDEPERVIALRFPDVRVAVGPARVADAVDPEAVLEEALAGRPEEVIAAAVRRAEVDPVGVAERLLLALPGPDGLARRARCIALEWITGERLGDSVERWRGWWDSAEGAAFAARAGSPP